MQSRWIFLVKYKLNFRIVPCMQQKKPLKRTSTRYIVLAGQKFIIYLKEKTMDQPVVSVVKYEEPLTSVRKAVDLAGGLNHLASGARVFIKSNVVFWT